MLAGTSSREPDEALGADEALASSIAIARLCGGFVGTREAERYRLPTTRERLSRYLADGSVALGGCDVALHPSSVDRTRAADVRSWIDTLSTQDPHAYCASLAQIVAEGDPVVPEDLTVWISAPAAFERLRECRAPVRPDRGTIGRRGDPIILEIEIRFVKLGTSTMGPILIGATDAEGRRVAWLATLAALPVPGTRCTVRGIVEGHDAAGGVQQTMLGHVDIQGSDTRAGTARPELPPRPSAGRGRSGTAREKACG